MISEVKETDEISKETVEVRLTMPVNLHASVMKKHAKNPRHWRLNETLNDLIAKSLKYEKKRKSII